MKKESPKKSELENLVNQGKTIAEISEVIDRGKTTTRYWLKKYGLKTKGQQLGLSRSWTEEDMIDAIKNSETYADALRKVDLSVRPGNYDTIKRFIQEKNIDISHMTGIACSKGGGRKKSLEEVMVKKSSYSRQHLKRRLIKNNIIKYKCAECGLKDNWQGKPITLVLDHINGVNDDHRLENLRFLCPNCNSQQKTFCIGKKRLEKRI